MIGIAYGFEQDPSPVLAEDVVEILTITQVELRSALLINGLIINRFPRYVAPDTYMPPFNAKFTVIVVSTSVGSPFSKYGRYLHCFTASIA